MRAEQNRTTARPPCALAYLHRKIKRRQTLRPLSCCALRTAHAILPLLLGWPQQNSENELSRLKRTGAPLVKTAQDAKPYQAEMCVPHQFATERRRFTQAPAHLLLSHLARRGGRHRTTRSGTGRPQNPALAAYRTPSFARCTARFYAHLCHYAMNHGGSLSIAVPHILNKRRSCCAHQ